MIILGYPTVFYNVLFFTLTWTLIIMKGKKEERSVLIAVLSLQIQALMAQSFNLTKCLLQT